MNNETAAEFNARLLAAVRSPRGRKIVSVLDLDATERARFYRAQAAAQRAERARLVAALGWAPEGTGGDAYVATTGELRSYLAEAVRA